MLDLLIVKTDRDYVTNCANEIIDKCKAVSPVIQISKRSLADTTGEKHTLSCKKLLFLLGDERGGLVENVAMWTTVVFPSTKDALEKVLVVYESVKRDDATFYVSESQNTTSLKTKAINTFKDVFQWWPHVLDFIYQRNPKGLKVFLKTDVEMKGQDAETESLDVEQSKLRQDLSILLQFNMAEQTDKNDNLMSCKMVIVVFGRNTSLSDSMASSLRLAKINGANVIFFFPHERTFDREIKRISTNRYTLSQHMEGILFVVSYTAMKNYKLPPVPKPLIPRGPLSIVSNYDATLGSTFTKADWFPYPYGLEETISIQSRLLLENGNNAWVEIARDVPATHNTASVQVKGQWSSSLSDYRIMSEDKDGNLSQGIEPNSIVYRSSMEYHKQLRCGVAYKPDTIPVHTRCTFCETEVDTVATRKVRRCAFRCVLCCCIPFLRKDVSHTCPNCGEEVRRYNGFQ